MLEYMSPERIAVFQNTVLQYYRQHGRHDLPWRTPEADGSFDPYKILVSEIMLQQTQVPRVLPKFASFIAQFPSLVTLADAPLADVLKTWSGLGYNRRAKFLWQTAQAVQRLHGGRLPDTREELVALPGIGANTAGAVMAYTFNKPVVFIETNIRTVYIQYFFADADIVHDRDITDMVAATLPGNSREWYWALMDYGTHVKQAIGNLSRRSAHYTKQSAFVGSRRQVRGQVLRALYAGSRTIAQLRSEISDERLQSVLDDLVHESLIEQDDVRYTLHGA
jgi:A/G-specific adenine glycosylase